MKSKLTITLANIRIAELEERSMVQRVIERTIREHRDELRRKLSKFQESEFHPDWSMLEAARASLREHMHLLKESQAANEKLQANVARLEIYESIALNKERQQKENAALKAAIVAKDAEVRRKAYEECAVLCEGLDMYDEDDPGSSYSLAIRRMAKEKIST